MTAASPPTVHGILETAVSVADVRRSAEFYRRLLSCAVLLESERLIALDVAGRSVLLLFQAGATAESFATPGGVIPGHGTSGRNHFALAIEAAELPAWRRHLEALGIAVESTVAWDGGAESIYFRDPDDHLVELITRGFWKTY